MEPAYLDLMELASARAARGEIASALAVVEQVRAFAPEEPAVYEHLFELHMISGAPAEAAKAAAELQRLDPGNVHYSYLLGSALLACGAAEKARAVLEEALGRLPTSWRIRFALARAELRLGRREAARALLLEVVAAQPTATGPANALAALYLEEPDGQQRARAVLAPILEQDPEDAASNFHVALSFAGEDKAAAIAHARRVLRGPDEQLRIQAMVLLGTLQSSERRS